MKTGFEYLTTLERDIKLDWLIPELWHDSTNSRILVNFFS